MKSVPQRVRKLDPLLLLALLVGIGAVVSTSVQAAERPAVEHPALMVSYQGALPALQQRLARMAGQADGLLRSVQGLLPARTDRRSLTLSLAAPEIEPAAAGLRDPGGFVVEEDTAMTLIFERHW
jgi:hypothetical protein